MTDTDALTHKCPKNGCEKTLPHHIFACREHWFSLSDETRRSVNRAWRQYQHAAGTLSTLQDYLEVRQAAVEELNA